MAGNGPQINTVKGEIDTDASLCDLWQSRRFCADPCAI